MKVSDPIMFGVAVRAFYAPVLDKHAAALEQIGFNADNGIGDLYANLGTLPEAKHTEIKTDIERSETRRVGKESDSTGRNRWLQDNKKIQKIPLKTNNSHH